MNFDFNDEQRAIKDAARDLLGSRYPLAEVRRLATEEERGFTTASGTSSSRWAGRGSSWTRSTAARDSGSSSW